MVFDFNKGQKVFVPREGGIFSPQQPLAPSGSGLENSNISFPEINAGAIPEGKWIIPQQVDKLLEGNKK